MEPLLGRYGKWRLGPEEVDETPTIFASDVAKHLSVGTGPRASSEALEWRSVENHWATGDDKPPYNDPTIAVIAWASMLIASAAFIVLGVIWWVRLIVKRANILGRTDGPSVSLAARGRLEHLREAPDASQGIRGHGRLKNT